MIFGMNKMLVLCVDNLGYHQEVCLVLTLLSDLATGISIGYEHHMHAISGAEAIMQSDRKFGRTSELQYLLDDVGCSGSETNLLDCLPQHDCSEHREENAGVHCLRKGIYRRLLILIIDVSPGRHLCRSHT